MQLTFGPAVPFLGIYPENKPPTTLKYSHTRLFTAALFITAKH